MRNSILKTHLDHIAPEQSLAKPPTIYTVRIELGILAQRLDPQTSRPVSIKMQFTFATIYTLAAVGFITTVKANPIQTTPVQVGVSCLVYLGGHISDYANYICSNVTRCTKHVPLLMPTVEGDHFRAIIRL